MTLSLITKKEGEVSVEDEYSGMRRWRTDEGGTRRQVIAAGRIGLSLGFKRLVCFQSDLMEALQSDLMEALSYVLEVGIEAPVCVLRWAVQGIRSEFSFIRDRATAKIKSQNVERRKTVIMLNQARKKI